MTLICVSILTVIGSDNGLSPGRRQAIIWTNVGILLSRIWGTNFSEIHRFSFKKMNLKMPSVKWRHFCRGLNVLTLQGQVTHIIRQYTRPSLLQAMNCRQNITWTNVGIWSIEPSSQEQTPVKIYPKHKRNASENIVCKMSAVLSRPHCVKYPIWRKV